MQSMDAGRSQKGLFLFERILKKYKKQPLPFALPQNNLSWDVFGAHSQHKSMLSGSFASHKYQYAPDGD